MVEVNELALFAGTGGGILAGSMLGWRCVCAVEIDEYARRVLVARQNDGSLSPFPIWDDIRSFTGKPWRGTIDVISGGFPCQDISCAGHGAGITGAKSALWKEMARIVNEVNPKFVFVENSPFLVSRGLSAVIADLTALGYDCAWKVMGAKDVGAPHRRNRVWILAANAAGKRLEVQEIDSCFSGSSALRQLAGDSWWQAEPSVGRVVDGLSQQLDTFNNERKH